ncbi:hypothetical protein Tco_1042586 [Tanacetum coccineum]|uniref:Uncharacterized protein n=1 Tax=Tanacetum coccineum TaxID=301880 RepID=A0ABQ5GJT9_9ASTR
MSNSNTNLQTQSSIKRYIDTKPNRENITIVSKSPYIINGPEKTCQLPAGSSETTTERYMENYKNVSQDIRDQMNAEAEKPCQIILTEYNRYLLHSLMLCPNAIVKCGKPLKGQIQFLHQLQPKERFVTLVKQRSELKTVSYHKHMDILKPHRMEVNEIRNTERLARTAKHLHLFLTQHPVPPSSKPSYSKHSILLHQIASDLPETEEKPLVTSFCSYLYP